MLICFKYALFNKELRFVPVVFTGKVWHALNATLTLTSTGQPSRPQPRLSAPDVNEKNNRKERIYMSLTPRHVRYKTSVCLALPCATSSCFFPHHGQSSRMELGAAAFCRSFVCKYGEKGSGYLVSRAMSGQLSTGLYASHGASGMRQYTVSVSPILSSFIDETSIF
jgi:hypothetical protein